MIEIQILGNVEIRQHDSFQATAGIAPEEIEPDWLT